MHPGIQTGALAISGEIGFLVGNAESAEVDAR